MTTDTDTQHHAPKRLPSSRFNLLSELTLNPSVVGAKYSFFRVLQCALQECAARSREA